MNAKSLCLILFAALPPGALATPPSSMPAMTFTVDCDQPVWPSLRQVAGYIGNDAFDPVYRVRKRLMLEGRRACRHGVEHVQLVFLPAEKQPPWSLTRIDKPR